MVTTEWHKIFSKYVGIDFSIKIALTFLIIIMHVFNSVTVTIRVLLEVWPKAVIRAAVFLWFNM